MGILAGGDFQKNSSAIFLKIQPLAIDKNRDLVHAKEAPGGEKAPPGTP